MACSCDPFLLPNSKVAGEEGYVDFFLYPEKKSVSICCNILALCGYYKIASYILKDNSGKAWI